MRVRGFVAVGLALVVGAGAMSGCTASSGGVGPRGGGCVPRLTVVPATAHPGEIVTVSSKDVCRDRVPDAGWEVSVTQPIEDGRRVSVRNSDRFDGSWSVPITLPRDFPAGETAVGIDNWDYSFCDDTGSCAAVSGLLQVEATPTPTP